MHLNLNSSSAQAGGRGRPLATLGKPHARASLVLLAGYLLSRERPIRILYRQRQGVHSIKIKACLAHHPARVTSIAFEWDLLPQWNRFCVEALKFRSDSPHQALVYGCSW